jgi:hypothetical protein
MDPVKQYAAESSYFEQFGLKWLRRMTRNTDMRLHQLNPADLTELQTGERWTIGWACLAGAISGGILGSAELVVRNQLGEEFKIASWEQQLPYWGVYLGVALVVSGIEILGRRGVCSLERFDHLVGVARSPYAVPRAGGRAGLARTTPLHGGGSRIFRANQNPGNRGRGDHPQRRRAPQLCSPDA